MLFFIFFFTFINLFCPEHLPCRLCEVTQPNESYIQHILERHHATQEECFFCGERPKIIKTRTNYHSHGEHLETKHTEFVIGLYRYYYGNEPNSTILNRWNPGYNYSILNGKDPLYDSTVQCLRCHAKVSGLCALYHFVVENWDVYSKCTICSHSSVPGPRKKRATFDFLAVINHIRTCGFESFSEHFNGTFPSLHLCKYNNNLSVMLGKPVQNCTTHLELVPTPIKEIYSEIYLCNRPKAYGICNKVLTKDQVCWHVAADITQEDYSESEKRSCHYCHKSYTESDYFFHLLMDHQPYLFNETLYLEAPPIQTVKDCND
jgi:hypothetical protein